MAGNKATGPSESSNDPNYYWAWVKKSFGLVAADATSHGRLLFAALLAAIVGPALVRFGLSFSSQPSAVLAKIQAQISADLGANLLVTGIVLAFAVVLLVLGGLFRAPSYLNHEQSLTVEHLRAEIVLQTDAHDELHRKVRELEDKLSRKPLDPKHEDDLRSIIDKLLIHPANLDAREGLLVLDLEAHQPKREVWSLRKELLDMSARSQQAYKAFDDQLVGELDRLDFGPYRRWVEQIAATRRTLPKQAPPPWAWNCVTSGGSTDLRLDNWPVARVTTVEEALAAYNKVIELWNAVPDWETYKALWHSDPQYSQVKQSLADEIADLKLTNFAGTGPCEHC